MGCLWMFVCFLMIGLCLAGSRRQRRRFLRDVLALLYWPVGTLVSLIRKLP